MYENMSECDIIPLVNTGATEYGAVMGTMATGFCDITPAVQ